METGINNKCKAFTSLEQSRKLAEILPLESADMEYLAIKETGELIGIVPFVKDDSEVEDSAYSHTFDRISCWSLAALLDVLPRFIEYKGDKYYLRFMKEYVEYGNDEVSITGRCLHTTGNDNLVDACYEMIIKLHEKNLEAIIRGSRLWESDMITRENYEYIFPEVKESENVRIRKAIYNCVKWFGFDSCFFKDVSQEECLAWLEKQGEQKPAEEYNITGISSNKSQGKLGEIIKNLKTTWSEGDENYHRICLDLCTGMPNGGAYAPYIKDEAINWLKSLKDRVQPKQKWSEEDENLFKCAIDAVKQESKVRTDGCLDEEVGEKVINWLKSLRPQSTWKPSDEQMGVIEAVINNRSFQRRHLDSLYEQLKKLKKD